MRLFRIAAIAAVTSLLTISTSSQAGNCWRPDEARAAQLRDFQTMLVVGALKCRAQFPETLAGYNRFVATQRPLLVATNDILKARFDREEGTEGSRAYDRHHTAAANDYSSDGRMTTVRGCQRIAQLASMAAQMARDELVLLADSIVPPPYSGACQAPATALTVAQPAAVTTLPVASTQSVPAQALAAPEPTAVVVPARKDRMVFARNSAVAPARIQKAAATNAPPASRDDALREALVALQAATAALQAATESAEPAVVVDAALPIRQVAHEPVVPLDPVVD